MGHSVIAPAMGVENFSVILDNPIGVFFPGQTVTGKVQLWIKEPKTFQGIYIDCKGYGHAHFTVSRAGNRNRGNQEHCRAHENYFDQRIQLTPYHNDGERSTMAAGQFEYQFALLLPIGIPASFESNNGHVRYTIKAVLARSWKTNYECKIPFTVNTIFDLNTTQEAALRTEGSDMKQMGFCCCKSKPITARAWIDQIGYVPGEKILFNGRVDNPTGKTMRQSKVQLVEFAEYRAGGHIHRTQRVISEQIRGEFGECDVWEQVPITIPPVAPSGLPFCNIISIAYRIQLVVDPRALSTNMVLPMNILIGNVPLRSNFAAFHQVPSAPALPLDHVNGDFTFSGLPPPSYENAMFGGDFRDEGDSKTANNGAAMLYNPRYITYNTK